MSRNLSTFKKLAAAVCMIVAFVVMASVFSPERTRAVSIPSSNGGAEKATPVTSSSTNPHEGLVSLGSLESRGFIVNIYSTSGGPRYSVYEQATGRELGALLTSEQVNKAFPELQLPASDFSAPTDAEPLITADVPTDSGLQ